MDTLLRAERARADAAEAEVARLREEVFALRERVCHRIDELLETERKYKLTQSDYAGEDTGREGEKQAAWSPEKSQRQQTFWRAAPHPALS